MSYLQDTAFLAYQAMEADKYDKHENRKPLNYGAINAVMSDTENTVNADELEKAHTASERTTQIPVLKRGDFSSTRVTSGASCTMIDNASTSAYVGLTWSFYKNGFSMVPAQYKNNQIGYNRDFAHKMSLLVDDVLSVLDTAAISLLETNKSQVNNADGNPYDYTANTIVVPTTDQEHFFNEVMPMMFQNDLPSTLKMVASPRVMAYISRINAQGAGNSTNLAYQEYLGQEFNYDRFLSIPTSYRDVIYMFAPGSTGMLQWIHSDFRENAVTGDGMQYGTMEIIPGLTVGVRRKTTCADNSTETGDDGDSGSIKDQFTIEFYYSFVTAYNSVPSTNPGTIFKAILAS
jgi:hypothetical protein